MVHATPFVKPGHDSPVADPATQGFAQVQAPDTNVHEPGARKSGLGAMLVDGFEIEKVGALVTG